MGAFSFNFGKSEWNLFIKFTKHRTITIPEKDESSSIKSTTFLWTKLDATPSNHHQLVNEILIIKFPLSVQAD